MTALALLLSLQESAWDPSKTWVFPVGILEWEDKMTFGSFPQEMTEKDILALFQEAAKGDRYRNKAWKRLQDLAEAGDRLVLKVSFDIMDRPDARRDKAAPNIARWWMDAAVAGKRFHAEDRKYVLKRALALARAENGSFRIQGLGFLTSNSMTDCPGLVAIFVEMCESEKNDPRFLKLVHEWLGGVLPDSGLAARWILGDPALVYAGLEVLAWTDYSRFRWPQERLHLLLAASARRDLPTESAHRILDSIEIYDDKTYLAVALTLLRHSDPDIRRRANEIRERLSPK